VDEQFEELKKAAIELWQTFDNRFGYVDEKVNAIKGIDNISDNFMFIVAMFDSRNQRRLAEKLSPETRKSIRERMVDGGTYEDDTPF